MALPEISVIIPVYKVEDFLHQCVESVLQQHFQDFEIILVDDASPDNCPAICDEYASQDTRIKVIHKENGGLGFARNSGLDIARGKYVCFLDSDDFLDPYALGYCHKLIEKEKADEVRFLFRRYRDGETVPEPIETDDATITVARGDNRAEPLLDVVAPVLTPRTFSVETTCSSCTALYRRSVIESASLRFHSERELISEDYIFNIEFAFAARSIIYTNLPFYCYRINNSSLSTAVRADRVEKAIIFSRYLEQLMRSHGYEDADVYAMGFTIGTMRQQNRLIFLSSLPLKEKRMIFNNIAELPYVKEIAERYPIDRLPLIQRVAFNLHIGKRFLLSMFVTKLRESTKKGRNA